MSLRAPFPWFGGKRRIAAEVWERLGDPAVYVEPFAGSLAVLLHRRRPAPRELVCDIDGGLVNFWRAVKWAPGEVARWADWPTLHDDLTARHAWLCRWLSEAGPQLRADPDYFDAKAAGWWVWGLSLWIGTDWCRAPQLGEANRIPNVPANGNPGGVSAQRDQIPCIPRKSGGRGVDATRIQRPDILQWFQRLQRRLSRVIVLNRGWESALSPSILQDTATSGPPSVGILLDPPYGGTDTYAAPTDDSVAAAAYRWALEHGDRYRIAYCAFDGDFEWPDAWAVRVRTFQGRHDTASRDRRDLVAYSPACVPEAQAALAL